MSGHDQVLNPGRLGSAAAAVTLAAWVLCSAFVGLFPEATASMVEHLFHLKADVFQLSMGWAGFAMGGICWVGFAYFAGFGLGAVYNKLGERG